MKAEILEGDCREIMKGLEDNSIDAIVTDAPYELGFMGKKWDASGIAYDPAVWVEAFRALKPGGHLLAFGGSRTYHRMASAVEDAGFEIRDQVMWLYGSGFPKSLDISKAIDKAAGVERETVGINEDYLRRKPHGMKTEGATAYGYSQTQQETDARITAPSTDAAKQWDGWGTALKPAHEPIVLARKLLSENTVAENVLKWGTGGLWIDGCRVGWQSEEDKVAGRPASFAKAHPGFEGKSFAIADRSARDPVAEQPSRGRWPANLIHDGSEEVMEEFAKAGESKSPKPGSFQRVKTSRGLKGGGFGQERADMRDKTDLPKPGYADTGTAARFFYCAKASKAERNRGCEEIEAKPNESYGEFKGTPDHTPKLNVKKNNNHPTVKPVALMAYLCRLITPPKGTVLDPFAGSGSTGIACVQEGFGFVGIEKESEYCKIAEARIAHAQKEQNGKLDFTEERSDGP